MNRSAVIPSATLNDAPTVLCLSGQFDRSITFMLRCKELGCRVLLLASESLRDAPWPKEQLDGVFHVQDENGFWRRDDVFAAVNQIVRTEIIDQIFAIGEFEVDLAAALREHLRLPGMNESEARYFRDKLAMRVRAREAGIPVPEFVHLANRREVEAFARETPGPWLIKPRAESDAWNLVIAKDLDELLETMDDLGDRQADFLAERYLPADVFHVDSLICDGEPIFNSVSQYGIPPIDITTHAVLSIVLKGSEEEEILTEMNRRVLRAMGHRQGVSHTEFFRAHEDGKYYFLETSARVGCLYIDQMVELSSGINLWREWANLELIEDYRLPEVSGDNHSGFILSRLHQENISSYADEEIVTGANAANPDHAVITVCSPSYERIQNLLNHYSENFQTTVF